MRRVRSKKDRHRQGLGEQIENPANNGVRVYARAGSKRKHAAEEPENELLSAKLSGRILKSAREQQAEIDAEDGQDALHQRLGGVRGSSKVDLSAGALAAALARAADSSDEDSDADAGLDLPTATRRGAARTNAAAAPVSMAAGKAMNIKGKAPLGGNPVKGMGPAGSDSEDEDDDLDKELRARTLSSLSASTSAGTTSAAPRSSARRSAMSSYTTGAAAGDPSETSRGKPGAAGRAATVDADFVDLGEEEVSAEDERALAAFMAPGAEGYRQSSLGDLVLAKLREQQKDRGLSMLPEEGEEMVPKGLDQKVVEVYRAVGKLLSRFTVGKVPKAFKIVPNLKNWEEVLWLTDPDTWSPHAMYEATKLFVSNLNARLAQRFLALVLLPRVRRDIKEHQKLHFALFMALKKATYKPGAFYKGLLLPLAASCTCSLREAVIFSSVLKRTSIPVLHSAAALLRMAEMEYCGTTSFFMRVLLDKKYALPYRVVDALVDHFVRFADDERSMPVVWHQTLLCFVQRYKDEVRPEDKGLLRKLCSVQSHYLVTPEVIRELDHSRARGSAASQLSGGQQVAGGRGAALQPAGPHLAVIGKNVSENVRNMPPVMMLDDE
ncbi:Bystin-domain-containing protein [Haematococcus lacustris]